MSSALFRKIWCIYLHPVRSYWHFFISHDLKIQDDGSRHLVFSGWEFDHSGVLIVSRAPSVSCATRLKLSICLFLFFYPGISSEPLNLSQQKFARWRQVVRNRTWRVSFFEFLRGLGWRPKMSLFARICPEWPSQNTIWRQNGDRYQKSKTVLFWPDNFTT